MKKKAVLLIVALLMIIFIYQFTKSKTSTTSPYTAPSVAVSQDPSPVVIADNLTIPWSLVFLPDKSLMFTERPGRVRLITPTGALLETPVAVIDGVKSYGEGGLLGITLHPQFTTNHFVYLYYTYSSDGNNTLNKVVRYVYANTKLAQPVTIVNAIPGNIFHNGGRLKFGPDGYLYITTGDSLNPSLAQNTGSLAGKILRVKDDGSAVSDNPFHNLVYSYGHRNPEGLAWDDQGRLWSTEHGPSAHDEVNLITKGGNYGWPTITGNETAYGLISPVLTSGNDTWAPSGLLIYNKELIFAGLRGSSLYKYNYSTKSFKKYFTDQFGRLRDVVLGPDGNLYLCTSNMDGRAVTHLDGDKIIRLDPSVLK